MSMPLLLVQIVSQICQLDHAFQPTSSPLSLTDANARKVFRCSETSHVEPCMVDLGAPHKVCIL